MPITFDNGGKKNKMGFGKILLWIIFIIILIVIGLAIFITATNTQVPIITDLINKIPFMDIFKGAISNG